ncbi:MAG: 16S rRNA (uracil(1498)-N(3))-methyltransferase [Bacteroidetes bacterium]|nr:16S rRNA (uracil(1498)-N(3))-methyltransferase [Bacteroidota bacterium]
MSEFFYVPAEYIIDQHIAIEGEEARHIARVLRKQPGDMVWVVDGAGKAYEVVIRLVAPEMIECEIQFEHHHLHEPDIDVTLAVAQLKNPSRMDWIIEKATELGVRTIIPLQTERTIARSPKEERWNNIALAAMKQSGRCILPRIAPPAGLAELLSESGPYDMKLIPYERTDHILSIAEALKHRKPPRTAMILIGPEGGFTDEEVRMAEQTQFTQVSLGRRRLRTETAAVVALSWVVGNE